MTRTEDVEDWIGRDFYGELGVPRTATVEQITRAYRIATAADRHAINYGPDGPDMGDRIDRLDRAAQAYAVLSHPRRRALYDQARSAAAFVVKHIDNAEQQRLMLRMLGLLPGAPLRSSAAVRVEVRSEQRRRQRQQQRGATPPTPGKTTP